MINWLKSFYCFWVYSISYIYNEKFQCTNFRHDWKSGTWCIISFSAEMLCPLSRVRSRLIIFSADSFVLVWSPVKLIYISMVWCCWCYIHGGLQLICHFGFLFWVFCHLIDGTDYKSYMIWICDASELHCSLSAPLHFYLRIWQLGIKSGILGDWINFPFSPIT